jgi:hypothetical protein
MSKRQVFALRLDVASQNTKLRFRTHLFDISAALFTVWPHSFARFLSAFAVFPQSAELYSIDTEVDVVTIRECVGACQHP